MGVLTTTEKGSLLYRGRFDRRVVEAIKQLPGRRYDPETKEWTMPPDPEAIDLLQQFEQVRITPEAWRAVQAREERAAAVMVAKQEEKPVPLQPMPLKGVEPFAHQITGYNVALSLFRLEVQDE